MEKSEKMKWKNMSLKKEDMEKAREKIKKMLERYMTEEG